MTFSFPGRTMVPAKFRVRPVFSLACLCAAMWVMASDRDALIGRWNFESSSYRIPAACHAGYIDIVSRARIRSSDGVSITDVEYSAEVIAEGFNLITQKLHGDGKADCHGKVNRKEANPDLQFFFVTLSDDGKLMKFYFTKDYYYLYRRSP